MVEQWTENPRVGSSILPLGTVNPNGSRPYTHLCKVSKNTYRSVAQLARAPGLGPGGRRFESYHSDNNQSPLRGFWHKVQKWIPETIEI